MVLHAQKYNLEALQIWLQSELTFLERNPIATALAMPYSQHQEHPKTTEQLIINHSEHPSN